MRCGVVVEPVRPLWGRIAGFVALGLALACSPGSQAGANLPRRLPLTADGAMAPVYPSPARLAYHPREPARSLARLSLPGGKSLLVGERGERWLFQPGVPHLGAASMLAPESLITAIRADGKYWFIGQSGTSYEASSALGDFKRFNAPAEALTGVSAAGRAVIGIGQEQSLLRSGDLGVTWVRVGPAKASLVDVALDPSGRGIALSVPESFYATRDFGESWEPSPVQPIGALELEARIDGTIEALTPLGPKRWNAETFGFENSSGPSQEFSLPPPPLAPDAGALAEGRATFAGGSYLELRSAGHDRWELLRGPVPGALSRRGVPGAAGCKSVRLAAFAPWVSFACFRDTAGVRTQPVEIWASSDHGQSFRRSPGRLDANLGSFRFAISREGRWIAAGTCPPGKTGTECEPTGLQIARQTESSGSSERAERGGATFRAAGIASAAPSLSRTALGVGVSADGRTAYAVGRRTKSGSFAIFVSKDGGRTFESEDLELGAIAADEDNSAFVEGSPGTRLEWISAAEDGTVALCFVHYGKRTLVVTDDRGKLLSTATPPEERALLSATGLRALAVIPESKQIWESLDGGVTWDLSGRLPIDLCPGDEACDVPVRCGPQACIIGHELTRSGWGRENRAESVLLLPPPRPVPPPASRGLSTPIACTPGQTDFQPLPGVSSAPRALAAAIGSAAWYAVGEDPDTASVTSYHARDGKLDPVRLLLPVARPEAYAFRSVGQYEGVAAIRYRLPEAKPGRTQLSDVEVVWDDVLSGTRGRALLAEGGEHIPGDYVVGRGRAHRAEPEFVSIASGGIYLRLHARSPQQPTLFLGSESVDRLPPVAWPPDERFPSRMEMIHADGVHTPVLLVRGGAAVVRAHPAKSGFDFDAFASGMIDPATFGLIQTQSIAYLAGRAGLHLEVFNGSGSVSYSRIFPFLSTGEVLGPPVEVPTQRALGALPVACNRAQRKRTPRVVAEPQSGTQHPVLIQDPALGSLPMLTRLAVLYGTREQPCASAFEAWGAPAERTDAVSESALVLLEDLEHSVLFRMVEERGARRIEYRSMTCRFDPNLELPPEVERILRELLTAEGSLR